MRGPESAGHQDGGDDVGDERSRLMALASGGVVYDWDFATGTVQRLGRLREVTGFDPSEAEPTVAWWQARVHPDDVEKSRVVAVRNLAEGQERVVSTYRFRHRDGRWIDLEDTSLALREPGGQVARVIGFATDVTERRRVEERLRESERHFRATFENAAVGIAHVAPDGRLLLVNETLCFITGYMREELLAQTFQEITYPDDLPDDLANVARLLAGEASTYTMEKRYVRKDGTTIWGHLTVSLVRTPAGEPDFFISVVEDVSARKRAEAEVQRLNDELHASVQELRAIFDAAPVGINVARDPACRVIVGNPALLEMLGATSIENISASRDDSEVLPFRVLEEDGRVAPPESLPMQRAAATGRPVEDRLYEIARADGRRLQILVRARPLRDPAGAVTGAVGICLDVTAARRAEAALREADRRKDEFLAMLAHELRNPLAAIAHAQQVARRGDADPDDLHWAAEVTDRQLRQLGRLIDDLLDVSRITRGKIRLKRERVDAATLVARAADSARGLLEARRHTLDVAVAPGPMPLHADPERLEQVLINLLHNAAKYTDEGGRVALTAGAEGGEAVIRVRDSGVGIPPEMLPHVFDLFAQVDDSLARSHGGLGIGLTLVRTLVEMHGGKVSAASPGPGMGSEFTLRLPLAAAPARSAAAPAAGASAVGGSGPAAAGARRVLLADDNPDTLRGLARLLGRAGRTVVTAADGHAALAAAREHRPEAAVLDIGLPGLNGYELAAALRREFGPGLLLVALSGYAQDRDRQRSRAAGFDHHLAKPVDLDRLLALLDSPRPG